MEIFMGPTSAAHRVPLPSHHTPTPIPPHPIPHPRRLHPHRRTPPSSTPARRRTLAPPPHRCS
uniref:Uncharacterized protein n=1 Tax=Oryza meridionalis TaxID=40149 RepID=A0A0E0EWQ1_9ORYZ